MLTDVSSINPTDVSGLFNVLPFNPTDLVNQSSNNMMAQLQAGSQVRTKLDGVRSDMANQVANLDLSVAKAYATDAASHAQDMFVTGFTKPSLTPIMPDNVTNPMSSDLLGGLTGELSLNGMGDGLFNEDMLSADGLEDMLDGPVGDLALAGAGMYVSGLTGGAVPPGVASAVIGTTADVGIGLVQGETPSLSSVAGDLTSGIISGYVGGGLPGGDLGIASSLSSSINGMNLGSGMMTSVLGETTASSLFTDQTGGMFEGVTDKVLGGVGDSVAKSASGNSFFSMDSITSAASSFAKSLSGDVIGSVGGVNLSDPSSLADGIMTKAIGAASSNGDASVFSRVLDGFTKDKGIFSSDAISLGENLINNPYNLRNYTDVLGDVGVDFGSIISKGASFGSDAVKSMANATLVNSGILSQEQLDGATSWMSSALDSKMVDRISTVGDRVAKSVLPSETYSKINALRDLGDIAYPKSSNTRNYNSGSRNNRKVSTAAERLFNKGQKFGSGSTSRKWRFDSDITDAIDEARYVLR